jgi:LPXTG-motif cell wall-anchored protein
MSTPTTRTARRARVAIAVLAGVATLGLAAGSASADEEATCPNDGKIDVGGEQTSIVVTAPEGKLIAGYCVKAGSANQGEGPEDHVVDPPAAEVTITHSSGKAISHYRIIYVDVPPPTTQPPTTTTTTPTTTQPPTPPETPAGTPQPEPQVASEAPVPEQVSSQAPAQLPATGTTSTVLVITAAALTGLGALTMAASRRRVTN